MLLSLLMYYNPYNSMKRSILFLALSLPFLSATADNQPQPGETQGKKEVTGEYKYQISVESMTDPNGITALNNRLDSLSGAGRDNRGWSSLRNTLMEGYKSTVIQKTVNASSNLLSLGVNLLTEQLNKRSNNFDSWSKAKKQQCTYTKDLSSEEQIADFYYAPSTKGALDPRDLKFNGFHCHNFIAVKDDKKDADKEKSADKEQAAPGAGSGQKEEKASQLGHDAFYLACSLRTDSLGLARLANHSKFMLQVDTLIFYPRYCNLPNVNNRKASESFDFNKLSNLELQIKITVKSSWINEAVMITNDQTLGEFVVRAQINKEALIGDSIFVYDGTNGKTQELVSISGDCFIVPRSFVGTSAEPLWGTGQYKLDMEVTESCQLNASYYHIEGVGNGEAVNFANLPGYKRWDKNVWQTEWHEMNTRNSGDSFLKSAWKAIRTAYMGTNWVKELIDPMATSLYQEETKQLNHWFDMDGATTATAGMAAGMTGATSTAAMGAATGASSPQTTGAAQQQQ